MSSLVFYSGVVQTTMVILCYFSVQEEAAEKSQKYKKGKFILERCAVTLEGGDGDGRHGSDRFGSERFGSERCGSNSIIGWGADKAPFADGARW